MAIQYTQWDQPRLLASLYFREMNSSPQDKLMSKANVRQLFSLYTENIKTLYRVKRWACFESKWSFL